MTAVTYTAKRSLITGHALGTAYKIALSCQDVIPGREKRETMNESLSGAQEAFLYFLKRTFQVTLAPLQALPLAQVLEFLDSVSGREPFTFDPWGKVDFPIESMQVYLTSQPYSIAPFVRIGQGGADDFYTVSFSVREA